MIKDTILSILISFGISAAMCPVLIPFLKRLKFGQQVRDDGPQAHLKKAGTSDSVWLVFWMIISRL